MGLVNIPPLNQTLLLINWPNKGILSFMNTEYWGKGDSNVTGGAVFCHETHCHLISDALKYRWAELYLYQTSKASMALRCWVKNITINVHIRSAWHAQTGNQNKNWRQNMVLHETTFWVGEKKCFWKCYFTQKCHALPVRFNIPAVTMTCVRAWFGLSFC